MSESGAIISAGTTSKDYYDEYEYGDNEVREWNEDEDTEDYHKDREEKLKDAGVKQNSKDDCVWNRSVNLLPIEHIVGAKVDVFVNFPVAVSFLIFANFKDIQ